MYVNRTAKIVLKNRFLNCFKSELKLFPQFCFKGNIPSLYGLRDNLRQMLFSSDPALG